jgi:transcriptional regulator with XRE-family HTH domain
MPTITESITEDLSRLNDDGMRPSVDPEAAEELLSDARLGQKIKRLRLKRSMGLVELGKQTGLSASFLSQLETGRVVPTLRNLARLALVFGKDLSYFFDTGDSSVFRVQRAKDRVRLGMGSPEPDYFAESFGILVPEGGLRPCWAQFLPGDKRDPFYPELYPGIEMTLVLSGKLALQRNGDRHVLGARDVAYISGEAERHYHCAGDEPCNALIISFDAETGEPRKVSRRLGAITPQ